MLSFFLAVLMLEVIAVLLLNHRGQGTIRFADPSFANAYLDVHRTVTKQKQITVIST